VEKKNNKKAMKDAAKRMPIEFIKKPFTKEESLGCLEEYVRIWFERTFRELTPPQQYSFKLISEKNSVIITAPTGSGKTLAAFMSILSELFKLGEKKKLKDSVYCIYVSPLKALDNDVKKNLLLPLTEIREIAKELGRELPEIRVGIRTSDIDASEKQKQLRMPPHILITTPESLAIMLNSPRFIENLKTAKFLVIDEIHELASNKRGVHLSLTFERLQEFVGKNIVRVGLGATLHPLEEAAKFLVGCDDKGNFRKCKIVDVSWYKPYDLKVICPVKDIVYASADALNSALYETLDELISKHRTTLIFTNTRSGTERVVFNLKEKFGDRYTDETIGAHHGSLSREIRLDVEERLKKGLLKAVVCSTSLELGIDIGYVDLVVQIGSPKSITRAVQRIGRSGHKFRDTAKGRIIAMDRDDLVECTVMLKNAQEKKLDKMLMPKLCLDILAQHIVGMGLTKKWKIDEALKVIKRTYAYRELSKEAFVSLLRYVAGTYAELQDQRVYGKIWLDEAEGVFGRRGRYTRIIYYLNLGAIPDEVKVDVYSYKTKDYIGGIEEEFLERLKPNDIFVLGGKLYKFKYAKAMRCYVEPAAKEEVPTIPAWFSEMLPLSFELAAEVQNFREAVKNKIKNESRTKVTKWLLENYPVDKNTANSIYRYFEEQIGYAGIKGTPGSSEIVIEETYDLEQRKFIVFHALFGRRVNDALARAIGMLLSDMINYNVSIIVSDNGFAFLVPEKKKVDMPKILEELAKISLEDFLKKSIRRTELMKRRFRHSAARSFMVLRNYKGHKISVSRQQVNSETLLKICEEIDKDFPVIKETYREILNEVLDITRAEEVIKMLKTKKIKTKFLQTSLPSPFAHNLIILGEADIIFMENRKKRLLELHKAVMKRIKQKVDAG